MRDYELTVAFSNKESQTAEGLTKVKALLEKHGFPMSDEKDMKDRELAYSVRKEERGHYYCLTFKGESEKIIKLEQDLKLVTEILKYLVARVEKV